MKNNNSNKSKLIFVNYVDLQKEQSKLNEIKNNASFLAENQSSTSLNNVKGGQMVNSNEYFNPMNQSITKIDECICIDKLLPKQAKYLYCFYDQERKEKVYYTDIQIKKYRRDLIFFEFASTYNEYYYDKKNVSLISFVVERTNYVKVRNFINTITKRFKRNNEVIYGFVSCNDYCYKSKKAHYHIVLASSLLSAEKRLKILELKKDKEKFKYQDVQTHFGLTFYVKEKELFGMGKERTYSRSRNFDVPK